MNRKKSSLCFVFLILLSVLVIPPVDLYGQFIQPPAVGLEPRMRCIGFNTEAEAARRFREGRGSWETLVVPPTPEVHRVAVILAEFQPDQDSLSTGNGLFGSLPFYQPHPDSALAEQGYVVRDTTIDSRSKAYYQRHMIWMSQYFSSVSRGQFTIEEPDTLVDITPIVRLPNEMGYYGDNAFFGLRQTEFVRDAIQAADTLSDIDFAQYDAVMIFHAGAGEESDFGPPPSYSGDTPNDLFSTYMPYEALKAYVGDNDPDYPGISTSGPDSSITYVRNAIIVPETIIQDSLYNPSAVYLDILGTMAHEYGHELGLPDLYDVDTSTRPAVGNFCLMASGLFNASGRLPAHPIAWCKLFLGWEAVRTVTMNTDSVELKGIEQAGEGTVLVRIPISSSEYFLLENRLRDPDFDGEFRFDDADGDNWPDLLADDYQLPDGTYTEFDFALPGIVTIDPSSGQPYDNPLLGSGTLIWHIDDEVIRNNFDPEYLENCVNCNALRPGVDLEEADGIQHLDQVLPTSIDPGYGSPYDSYGGKVEGIKEEPNVEFSAESNPKSDSYTGGPTRITISGFRSLSWAEPEQEETYVDSIVAIDISFARSVPGWPVTVVESDSFAFDFEADPAIFDGNGICAADIDGDGEEEIAILTREGDLFGWDTDGTNFCCAGPEGNREVRARFSIGQAINGTPAMGELTGEGGMEIVTVTEGGDLFALFLRTQPLDPNWAPLSGFPVSLGERVTSSPLLLDFDSPPDDTIDLIVVGTDPESGGNGRVYAIQPDGSIVDGWPITVNGPVQGTPAAGDMDRDGNVNIVVATGAGYLYRVRPDGSVAWSKQVPGESFVASPTLGDIDRDGDADRDGVAESPGDLEIVLGSTSGRITVYQSNGQIFGGGPVEVGGEIRVPISLGDIDKDGFVEMVALVDGDRKISVYRSNTSRSSIDRVENFPKYVSSSVAGEFFSPPLLADLDGNGQEEIVFGTASQLVYAYDLGASSTPFMRFPLGGKGINGPFIGRSSGDTLAIFAADDRGMVYGWQLDVLKSDVAVSWAQEGRDSHHSSANGDSLGQSTGGPPVPFSAETFTIYPNPAPGRDETDQVKITYSLDEEISDMSLDIYTLSGRHYQRIVPPSPSFLLPDARHVLTWDIGEVPSGVYIVRLEIVRQNGLHDHLIKKAAIVK